MKAKLPQNVTQLERLSPLLQYVQILFSYLSEEDCADFWVSVSNRKGPVQDRCEAELWESVRELQTYLTPEQSAGALERLELVASIEEHSRPHVNEPALAPRP